MIAHWNIVQGTEEWHRLRYGKIGGTASKGLFVDSDTLLDEVLSEHLEEYEPEDDTFISSDMQRGIELEPTARLEVSKYAGIEFKECGWLQSEECGLIGISPDGITEDETQSCETKCPAKKKHTTTVRTGEIPKDNLDQCIHYFTVNPKLQVHYFVSFRPESKYPLFVKKLTRESLVNRGTEKKPDIKSIEEWTKIALSNALKLEAQLNQTLKQLEQI